MSSPLELALRWLKARDHLEEEVRAKLARRGFEEVEINATLQRLRELSVLCDERTRLNLADSATRKPSRGRTGATNDLIRRGIEPEEAEKLVQNRLSPEDEKERARSLMATRAEKLATPAQAARFLAARGFSEEIITELIEERYET